MAAQVFIDGTELIPPLGEGTSAITGEVTRRLNLSSRATCRVPHHLSIGGVGSRMKVVLDSVLWHHGFVQLCETESDENVGYTVYNSEDISELWRWRPCRDFLDPTPGNMIDPNFPFRLTYPGGDIGNSGPQMILETLFASENLALGGQALAEGPLFLTFGGFESGGVNLAGGLTNWPMTISDLVSLLVSTGEVDVVITPIDSGGNMGLVDVYNGKSGSDLSGSITLEYGVGARNIKNLRWNDDISNVTNKLQYFFGPKKTTSRYKSNITGTDPCLPPTVGATQMTALEARRVASRAAIGTRMEIQEFDVDVLSRERTTEGSGLCEYMDPVKTLFRNRWYRESFIRVGQRRLVHITPIAGYGINSFGTGDIVGVRVAPSILGGFYEKQRIYALTVSWDSSSVLSLSEIVTSADQEGA